MKAKKNPYLKFPTQDMCLLASGVLFPDVKQMHSSDLLKSDT